MNKHVGDAIDFHVNQKCIVYIWIKERSKNPLNSDWEVYFLFIKDSGEMCSVLKVVPDG